MPTSIYPLRLSLSDRRLFQRTAKAEQMSMADWLREAARERAKKNRRKWASPTYPDWPLSEAAERQKDYVARKLKRAA